MTAAPIIDHQYGGGGGGGHEYINLFQVRIDVVVGLTSPHLVGRREVRMGDDG
jgi:hypothetical protein